MVSFTEIAGVSLAVLFIFIIMIVFTCALALFILWIWALVHCLASKLTSAQKLFWIFVIIFFNIVGALLYFIFSKVRGDEIVRMKNNKGKRLFRSKKYRMIGGVCGGIAEYLDMDPTVIRLLWVLFTLMGGAGVIAYIIAWIIIPEQGRYWV
ncbi:MAG: hypothetical protein DRN71_01040 [Candidatus Nanohalarchaeota archaeon]|nr:MAG: hypothetical protein DRN71_01040 [Candidatus Nanohaloarchaeota archaeon]